MGRNRSSFAEPTAEELAALPDEQRCVLTMFTQGHSYGLIEDMTGWPMGTVKSRLARARRSVLNMRAENPIDIKTALENGDSK